MGSRVLQNNFTGGIIASSMMGRVDNAMYQNGAFLLENFIVEPQGSLLSRPGFQYVGEALDHDKPVRLVPFRYASDQTLVLVFGPNTLRICTEGLWVLDDDGAVYEIETPYDEDDIETLDYSQNADIVTITSTAHPPIELIRYGATDWRFSEVTTAPTISPPSSVALEAVYPEDTDEEDKGILESSYVVTAVDDDGKESIASEEYTVNHNFYLNGGRVKISWSSVEGASLYRVYRSVCGVYGFLGQTEENSILDYNDDPDCTYTPPKYDYPFQTYTGIKMVNVIDGGSGYVASFTSGTYTISANAIISFPRLPPIYTTSSDSASYVFTLYDSSGTRQARTSLTARRVGTRYVGYNIEVNQGNAHTTQIMGYFWVLEDALDEGINVAFTNSTALTGAYVKITGGTPVLYPGQVITAQRRSGSFTSNNISRSYDVFRFTEGLWPMDWKEEGYSELREKAVSLMNCSTPAMVRAFWGEHGAPCYEIIKAAESDGNTTASTASVSIEIEDETGSGAVLQPVVENGSITSVIVVTPGSNYTDPVLTVVSTTGSGAVLEAVLYNDDEDEYDYPAANTTYDQRRIFAGTNINPLTCWMTNAGYQDLMMYHLPTMSDDRIIIEAVASDADRIKHAAALDSLILFTGSSELRVYTQNSDALSPDSVAVRAQSYVGANDCQPVIANNSIVFAAARGGHIWSIDYTYTVNGYSATDRSVIACHLFDGYDIKDIAFQKAPYSIVWAVSSDGSLLGLTYSLDQNLTAWHRHTTDGIFEHICCVAEGTEDRLYAVVRRQVNGQWKRYIERMGLIKVKEDENVRKMDCWVEDTAGSSTNSSVTVSGLDHLEGKDVTAIIDGVPLTYDDTRTVSGGKITLPKGGSNLAVGLPYTSTLITVPLTAGQQAGLQGLKKNVSEIFLRIAHDGDVWSAFYPSDNGNKFYKCKRHMREFNRQNPDSQVVKLTLNGYWDYSSQIIVEHRDCQQLQIQAVVANTNIEKEGQ